MKFKPKTIWVVEISSCKDCMLVGYAKTYEKALEYGRKYLEEEKGIAVTMNTVELLKSLFVLFTVLK